MDRNLLLPIVIILGIGLGVVYHEKTKEDNSSVPSSVAPEKSQGWQNDTLNQMPTNPSPEPTKPEPNPPRIPPSNEPPSQPWPPG